MFLNSVDDSEILLYWNQCMNLEKKDNCEYNMTNLILVRLYFLTSTFIVDFILSLN